ncbi:lytic transglycosylase domain-containing protein [Lentibacillus sp. N15]|uniref:lytic transglycosylase domain-containing protein n=1 Tax=Lentibacillus songyuanensis TaxID=3136161 RepID=UPI0031BB12BD
MEIRDVQTFMQYILSANQSTPYSSPMADLPFKQMLQEKMNQAALSNHPIHSYTDPTAQSMPNAYMSTPASATTAATGDIQSMIANTAEKFGIDPKLIDSIIKMESNYNPNAKSDAGAQGLMQLMPGTARSLGVTNPYDAQQNMEGGTKYLAEMLQRYNGNLELAIAAYNAGPGNVDKYQGIPPFNETQNYVKNVLNNYLA